MSRSIHQHAGRPPERTVFLLVIFVAAFLQLFVAPLAAQSKRGTANLLGMVKSAESGKPLSGAVVKVIGLNVQEVSRNRGNFKIERLSPGLHYISAEYLGFKSDTVQVILSNAATTYVTLTLQTAPVPLPDLKVSVRRVIRSLRLAEFYERRDRGLGKYITADELERHSLIMSLRMIPGVRVQQCVQGRDQVVVVPIAQPGQSRGQTTAPARFLLPGARGMRQGSCYELNLARGVVANQRCTPQVWIDGHLINSYFGDPLGENPFNRLRSIPESLIEGVEVYRNGALAPAKYQRFGGCGVLLVWTKGR